MIKANASLNEGWVYDANLGWPPDLVQTYCVQDQAWQACRLSMKGKTTVEKLIILSCWINRAENHEGPLPTERARCQVENYLGALRRGGQLDSQNRIRKHR